MCWFSLVVPFTPIASASTGETHRLGLFRPLSPTKSLSSTTISPCRCRKSDSTKHEEEDEPFQVLTAIKSKYNDILIVDTPKARMLLLDSSHNVHSILQKGDDKWTGSYWDEFASLPPIVPEGPIAIYGLGGGTAAHLMLDVWPSLQLEGWEIDEILIDKAREYFGLSNLERNNKVGGRLQVHVDDAFSPVQHLPARYAGIIIDLFSDGKVLSQLQEQYDYKNAFLHGDLKDKVYMDPSPGFNNSLSKNQVWQLKNALYGLKQLPRASFGRFEKAMQGLGCKQS
ncbi:hypothetical protein DITRI_Ditri06bG0092100 [Diplodiscus trichospermus]